MDKGLKIWLVIAIVVVAFGGMYAANNYHAEKQEPTQAIETQKNSAKAEEQAPKEAQKEVYDIKDINSSLLGQTITVKCRVISVRKPSNTTFFTIKDISEDRVLKGVLFNKTDNDNTGRKDLLDESVSNGNIIYIEGEIVEYKNALEIKAWKVYTN